MEGEQPRLGDLLAMVANYLLTGMILQVVLGREAILELVRVSYKITRSHNIPIIGRRLLKTSIPWYFNNKKEGSLYQYIKAWMTLVNWLYEECCSWRSSSLPGWLPSRYIKVIKTTPTVDGSEIGLTTWYAENLGNNGVNYLLAG